nr:MAG TPA: hypothetical protein [Caudoviricetes sp.]
MSTSFFINFIYYIDFILKYDNIYNCNFLTNVKKILY